MRHWHLVTLAAVLLLLSVAAFAQNPAPQTAGEAAMTAEQQAKAETQRITSLLVAPVKHTWILQNDGGTAMITFHPSGKIEVLSIVKRNSLMPRGATSMCTGQWSLSGMALTVTHRVCTTGQTSDETVPDMTGTILKLDETTLTVQLDDGGTFTFKAQH
jgi:hypothetical protein